MKLMSKYLAARYLHIVDGTEAREYGINHDARMTQIGNLMRLTRQERKISLRELARQLGVSAAYLSDMERGRRTYSMIYLDLAMKRMRAMTAMRKMRKTK